jgi:predicted DNA-binding mobile mystery protein A
MIKSEYRDLRIKQLDSSLSAFIQAKTQPRPQRGWLRAIREACGLPLDSIARELKTNRQGVQKRENAEATDRITLRTLRRVADAMGCELVYAIVPKSGTIQDLAERRLRDEATKRVRAVEHTMALENQATGNLEEKIKDEVKRIKAGRK